MGKDKHVRKAKMAYRIDDRYNWGKRRKLELKHERNAGIMALRRAAKGWFPRLQSGMHSF